MNVTEAIDLCRYVSAACPQQRFDQHTPKAWCDLLADIPALIAMRAAREVAMVQPFVAPSEIRHVARRMRTTARRAVKRRMREAGVLGDVEAEADRLISLGAVSFEGIDLLGHESADTLAYRPEVARLEANPALEAITEEES